MLAHARLYAGELERRFLEISYDMDFKYYHNNSYWGIEDMAEDGRDGNQFVSLNDDGEVIGFIGYEVDWQTYGVSAVVAVNFDTKTCGLSRTFIKDLYQAVDDIFCKFNYNDIQFSVVIGNPAERIYDRALERIGGRVVGTFYKNTKLMDGQLYDMKFYQVMREDYIKSKKELP